MKTIGLEHICKEDPQTWQEVCKCREYAQPHGSPLLFSPTATNLLPISINSYDIKKG